MKKKILVIIAAVLCVGLVCGGFYLIKQRSASSSDKVDLTDVQKLNTRDLEKDYPQTPREVVKLFNKIIRCYYNDKYTEDELKRLTEQAWKLFDSELQENNPLDEYLKSVQADVADYKERSRRISNTSVCDSNDVRYLTDNGDDLAYVTASYFVKEKNGYTDTDEMYVLRKDADEKWKILVFYQIEGDSTEE